MARFRFNLEFVLQQRIREERDAQIAFSEVNRERVALESQIRMYQQTIVGFKRDLRGALSGGTQPDQSWAPITLIDVRLQAGASLLVMGKAQSAVLDLVGVHKRLETARAELLDAARSRKGVEMLRERQFEKWKRDEARREATEMDDLATMRAGRGSMFLG